MAFSFPIPALARLPAEPFVCSVRGVPGGLPTTGAALKIRRRVIPSWRTRKPENSDSSFRMWSPFANAPTRLMPTLGRRGVREGMLSPNRTGVRAFSTARGLYLLDLQRSRKTASKCTHFQRLLTKNRRRCPSSSPVTTAHLLPSAPRERTPAFSMFFFPGSPVPSAA
jgi:hypothetical protein